MVIDFQKSKVNCPVCGEQLKVILKFAGLTTARLESELSDNPVLINPYSCEIERHFCSR